MKKRLIISSVISIFLVLILLIGSTYSIFTSQEIDETANVYKTGNLNVTYKVSSNTIQFTDPTPITTEEADSVIPYRITVTNTGNVAYEFDVILNDTTSSEENTIDYQYIMTKVGYLEPISLSNCTNNIIKENVIVPAGEKVDIDIRIWLDSTLPNTEMGNSFYAKLKIDGLAVYNDNEEIDNSKLSLRYMNSSSAYDFRGDAYRNYITMASFVDYIDTSNAGVNAETNEKIMWDMSTAQDKSVIAWLEENETTDEDGNIYYDLYIGSEDKIYAKGLNWFFGNMEHLANIEFDNLSTHLTTSFDNMFYTCRSLFYLDVSSFNTSNATSMLEIFGYTTSLVSLDLSNFNTSKINDMRQMFDQCQSLTSLDLSSFDTSNVTNMTRMFSGCKRLATLNISNFDTSNVTNMSYMFNNCPQLTNLDLSGFDTSNVTNMSCMFYRCSELVTTISIMNVNTTYTNMFTSASTIEGASITVYYVGDNPSTTDINESTESLVESMIVTGIGNIINGGCTGDYCSI